MSEQGVAAFLEHHAREVRPLYPWLAPAHVTDDANPSDIAAGTGTMTTGALALGSCTVGMSPDCAADGRFHFKLTPDLIPGPGLVWHEAGHQVDRTVVDREGMEDRLALYSEWADLIGRPELVHDGKAGEYFASGLTKAMTGQEGGYITFGDAYPVERARAWYVGLETWRNRMIRRHTTPVFGVPTDSQGYAEVTITLPEFDPTRETEVRVHRVGLAQGERYQGHPIGQAGFVPVNGQTLFGARVRVTNDSVKGGTAYLQVIAEQQL